MGKIEAIEGAKTTSGVWCEEYLGGGSEDIVRQAGFFLQIGSEEF